MTFVKFLILLSIFQLIFFWNANSQYVDTIDIEKYKKVYNYIDSAKFAKNKKLNVNRTLGYISPIDFENEIRSIDASFQILSEADYNKHYYFTSYFEKQLGKEFKYSKLNSQYLLLSKPIRNFLLVELRDGFLIDSNEYAMPLNPFTISEFGAITRYLFFFDDNNNITRVFRKEIMMN